MKDLWWPLLILLGIISIGLFGGVKNTQQNPSTVSSQPVIPSPSQRQMSQSEIAFQVQNTQYQTNQLKQKVAAEQEAKISSQYKDKITMVWGWSTTDPNQEYIEIDANYANTTPINITGWQLMSTSTGQIITVPQSTALYLANSSNNPENVWLSPGEKAYIITGRSPIGYGMHTNICSGYLSQFNSFTPYLYTSCPIPRNENLISIPRTPNNNNCFDLVDSFPACRIPSQSLNNIYSSQCQDFVINKVNYQGCVNTHKNDSDFYSPKTWYVYLNRDQSIWQPRREVIILSDGIGKKVYTLTR